ncbi:hypothetical protein D917_07012 [Trichinella nativa]|uniref:EGF-like domain-containing protein n=1 Tax=Trichinella nativa TaxID=6335 RepID=A0A1Y3EQ89_9BILA|nr:hypothetical protein D917_07012 [Trichinella nativa]
MNTLTALLLLFGSMFASGNGALPNITCCNGGVPYVDLHVWPVDGNRFEEVADGTECRRFFLQISDSLLAKFVENGGTLTCKCPRDFYGTKCSLNRQAQTWGGGDGQSFKMLFLQNVLLPNCRRRMLEFQMGSQTSKRPQQQHTFDNGEIDYPFSSVRRTPIVTGPNLYVVNNDRDQTDAAPPAIYEDPYDHGPPPAYEAVIRQAYLQPPPQFSTIEKKWLTNWLARGKKNIPEPVPVCFAVFIK